ncbi:nucleotidyltransferase family protein [Intrasporangium sp. YIM S08009]|uniref:nucleotidyltransferase family protein n=1 Tax=Intrasporangium zincisolvens TaxID=3080018 RepID=UPI002B05ABA9|nr:nucleotidyltransferase family protein [Intrasporangium sp. YIM S08009]
MAAKDAGAGEAAPIVDIPHEVRIAFAHAAAQQLVDRLGARAVHVKGAALDPSLVPGRSYSDADVLVHPSDVPAVLSALRDHGWDLINTFAYASSFEHSATFRHEDFGLLDVHRLFPGTGPSPEAAFETLWSERQTISLGGRPCAVPSRPAQACLLLLHAARAGNDAKAARDIDCVWTSATDAERAGILEWVDRLDAQVAFSVITGTLDDHAADPAYDLWRVAARGGTRVEEWRARIRAARGLRAKLTLVGRSVLVNVEHLSIVRGAPLTRREVVAEFFARPVRGAREQLHRRRGGGS